MKIVFVYFDFMKGAGGKYYEGIASISAVLRQHGHSTGLFHIAEFVDCRRFMDIFRADYSDADVVGFSSTSNAFYYVPQYAGAIKKDFPRVPVVCGGIHPTLCPEESIRHECIDMVCVGEGEYPMLDLCTSLQAGMDITAIKNLWVRKNDVIFKNPPRPLIENLDSLPVPDREIFDFEHSVDKEMKRLVFMGSRGCPFHCTHCCNHAMSKICPGSSSYVRFKSVGRLISEIKSCLEKHSDIKSVHFLDDILTLKKDWFREFTGQYKQQINLPYVCNGRFDLLDEEQIDLLKQSGCFRLQLGLESGDDYIRTEVLKRKQSREQILEVSELLRKKGIEFSIYNMVGIPFETPKRVLNTVKMTAQINPYRFQMSIYYPYIKTDLYEMCRQKGFLTGKRLDSYFETDTILNLPDFPRENILFAYENFETFVSYYIATAKLPGLWRHLIARIVDFMWLHPRVYRFAEPKYRTIKKVYKKLRSKRL